jgi:hypothetical protein
MNHGASGSMIIDGSYNVIGIYWGAFFASWNIGATVSPRASIFNQSSYKDFTQLSPKT